VPLAPVGHRQQTAAMFAVSILSFPQHTTADDGSTLIAVITARTTERCEFVPTAMSEEVSTLAKLS
jgi:hypothetical protein